MLQFDLVPCGRLISTIENTRPLQEVAKYWLFPTAMAGAAGICGPSPAGTPIRPGARGKIGIGGGGNWYGGT